MSDATDRLTAALEGRYTIELELGAGGMATVYLAEDLRHHRKVALKVLRPDLAATLGPERFLREIEIAANLTHPHVLPLYDSGEADGFLFYVLPYIEGESLRDRLVREGELPIGEVVRILRDVVDALAHAHDQGVVHRDIKPDNVMLSGRHAMVTDFGVAKAVSEATGRHQLTTVGVALGTPAYMSPEQAEASEQIDHRADIYAVGALAYELLAGRPPFVHKSPQMTLVAHVTEAPEPVTVHRDSAPPALAGLVMRCLEKRPADRWQSAEEILGHLEALATPSGGLTPTGTVPVSATAGGRGLYTPAKIAAAAAVVVAAVAVGSLVRSGGGPGAASGPGGADLDPNVVAIVPFGFLGPDELDHIGEGVGYLLAARFTGEVGPRAFDPDAVRAHWQEVAGSGSAAPGEEVARTLGAGLVLTGSVVSDPSGLNINASLRNVLDGSEVAAAAAQGPPDSLTALVDRLAAGLLSLSTGEYERSLEQLTSASPDALREYLLGQREFRRASFFTAVEHFRRAVEIDSTFALAALAWGDASNNVPGGEGDSYVRAWRHRDRLSERDRIYLRAHLGPNYPEQSTTLERVRAYEEAARLAPDRAAIWYFLGEQTFHRPQSRAALEEYRRYFERALELDPTHGLAKNHLMLIDMVRGDLEDLRVSVERLAASDTDTATSAAVLAALFAQIDADSSGFRSALSEWEALELDLGREFLWPIAVGSPEVVHGSWVVEAQERFNISWVGQQIPSGESFTVFHIQYQFLLDLGRPKAAEGVLAGWESATGLRADPLIRLTNAIYHEVPEAVGDDAAAALEASLADVDPAVLAQAQRVSARSRQLLAMELWRISRDDHSRTEETISLLRSAADALSGARELAVEVYALLLEALVLEEQGAPGVRATLDRMDDLFRQRPPMTSSIYDALLEQAALYERLGDPARALATLERESIMGFVNPFGMRFWRDRGRLAALMGDTEQAIRAYRYYLNHRYEPEPELEAEVEEVRRALAELTGN